MYVCAREGGGVWGDEGGVGRVRDKRQSEPDRQRQRYKHSSGKDRKDSCRQITTNHSICRLLLPCFAFFLFFSLFVLS